MELDYYKINHFFMVNIKFKYNIEKEAKNWYDIASDKSDSFGSSYKNAIMPIPDSILDIISSSPKDKAIEKIIDYLECDPRQKLKDIFISEKISGLEKIWEKLGNKLIGALNKVTGKKFDEEEYTAYITHLFICDYNISKKYFFLSLYHSAGLNFSVLAHELIHFITYKHFKSYCIEKGLTEPQFQDLKESVTVVLNSPVFDKILLIEDYGYPDHKELRSILEKKFLSGASFDALIDYGIKYLLK